MIGDRSFRQSSALVFAASLALGACSREAIPPRPADAAGVSAPAEYAFGDVVRQKDWRATEHVLDQLEDRFGARTITVRGFTLTATADPKAVEAHYAAALARDGWTRWDLSSQPDRAWSFALISPRGSHVVAFEALDPAEGADGLVPMNMLTNLPETWSTAVPRPASGS